MPLNLVAGGYDVLQLPHPRVSFTQLSLATVDRYSPWKKGVIKTCNITTAASCKFKLSLPFSENVRAGSVAVQIAQCGLASRPCALLLKVLDLDLRVCGS